MWQIGHGGMVMSDTCNTARKAKSLLVTAIGESVEANHGAEAWAKLSEGEKTQAKYVVVGDCYQHLRNILLDHMSHEATAQLKDDLGTSLEAFSSFERMSTDPNQLVRAVYKELHHEGDYYKGKGREFESWRRGNEMSTP